MDHKAELDKIVKSLPPGCELFIHADVAEAMLGKKAGLALDKIATSNDCAIGYRQSFESTPDEEGFRISRPKNSNE